MADQQRAGVTACEMCRWAFGDDHAVEWCDHTPTQVDLAMALARWAVDDSEATHQELVERACAFLDETGTDDASTILALVPHDDSTVWTVESHPEADTEGGQGFAVNGVTFCIEYQPEGPGLVRLAASWRPECEDCGERVDEFHDRLCAACKGAEAHRG